jgi:hypothetical protein
VQPFSVDRESLLETSVSPAITARIRLLQHEIELAFAAGIRLQPEQRVTDRATRRRHELVLARSGAGAHTGKPSDSVALVPRVGEYREWGPVTATGSSLMTQPRLGSRRSVRRATGEGGRNGRLPARCARCVFQNMPHRP